MNSRERVLATALIVIILVGGGGYVGKRFYWDAMIQRQNTIESLKKDIAEKQGRVFAAQQAKVKLDRWKQMSLPADTDPEMANTLRNYTRHLRELMAQSGISTDSLKITHQKPDSRSVPTLAGKKPAYTRLTFTIDQASGDVPSLVKMLERFYRSGMMHKITKISVQRPRTRREGQKPTELNVSLSVEALVLHGTEVQANTPPAGKQALPEFLPARKQQQQLLAATVDAVLAAPSRGLAGLVAACTVASNSGPVRAGGLAVPPRLYTSVGSRNVFFGPPPPPPREEGDTLNIRKYVHLTDVTRTDEGVEAYLWDRYNNKEYSFVIAAGTDKRVQVFEHLRISPTKKVRQKVDPDDGDVTLPAMVVVLIDTREVVFRMNDKAFNQLVRDDILREESDGTYKVDRAAWDRLEKERTVTYDFKTKKCRIGLTYATVVSREKDVVTVRPLPFHALHVGQNVDEALKDPLSEDRAKEFQPAVAAVKEADKQ